MSKTYSYGVVIGSAATNMHLPQDEVSLPHPVQDQKIWTWVLVVFSWQTKRVSAQASRLAHNWLNDCGPALVYLEMNDINRHPSSPSMIY